MTRTKNLYKCLISNILTYHLTQEKFDKIVDIILKYRNVYATTKFDVGKTKVKLNLPMKKDAVFKKQRVSKVPIHLRDRTQIVFNVLKKYDIISPVNKEQLSTGNTFTNPVIILRKGESLKIVFDARYLNSMIDESKGNWPIEPVDIALTRKNGTRFTTADLNSAYNQIPLNNESMRYIDFTILETNSIVLDDYSMVYQLDRLHSPQSLLISFIP